MVEIDLRILTAFWIRNRQLNAQRLTDLLSDIPFITAGIEEADRSPVAPWSGVKRAIQRGTDDVTHHIVLQDDVGLTDNFPTLVKQAIEARTNDVLGLFIPRQKAQDVAETGCPWGKTTDVWGVGWVIPDAMVDDLIAWQETYVDGSFGSDDVILSIWLRYELAQPAWFPLPTLVEHLGHDDPTTGNSVPVDRTSGWFKSDLSPDAVDYSNQSDPVRFSKSRMEERYGEYVSDVVFE